MDNEQLLRQIQSDQRATDELIQLLLSFDYDDDEYWNTLDVLHFRGNKDVLDSARQLCQSIIPNERVVGVDILMKIGDSSRMLREAKEFIANILPEDDNTVYLRKHHESVIRQLSDIIGDSREYPKEAISELLPMLDSEQEAKVMQEVVTALGWYIEYHESIIEKLAILVKHPDNEVRYALAMSIKVNHPIAIRTLITLSGDTDEEVRNWSTFALATLTNNENLLVDLPEIRETLYARMYDKYDIVRYEAFRGLVDRNDERVVEEILTEILTETIDDVFADAIINAGIKFGDSRILPALLWIKEYGVYWLDTHHDMNDDEKLITAIAKCLPDIMQ
jgi:HEAT repeat protein